MLLKVGCFNKHPCSQLSQCLALDNNPCLALGSANVNANQD